MAEEMESAANVLNKLLPIGHLYRRTIKEITFYRCNCSPMLTKHRSHLIKNQKKN